MIRRFLIWLVAFLAQALGFVMIFCGQISPLYLFAGIATFMFGTCLHACEE